MTEHVYELLNAYIDEELTEREKIVVDGHVASCDSCKKELIKLTEVQAWTKELYDLEPVPEFLSERIFEDIHQIGRAGKQLEVGIGIAVAAILALFISMHSFFNHGVKVLYAFYRVIHSVVVALPLFSGFPPIVASSIIGTGLLLVLLTLPILWKLLRSMSVEDRRGWQ